MTVRGLDYSIDGTEILQDVSLEVPEGTFVGLIGPNGCGKSTLLKNIYKTYRPQKDTVYIDGKDVVSLSAKEMARQAAVVAQENQTEFDLEVLDMVMYGRYAHRRFLEKETEEDLAICRRFLEEVGLKGYENRSFFSLSGGEKQRVLMARTLAQESRLILLDEPTNHLDQEMISWLEDYLRSYRGTVLMVTHDRYFLDRVTNRILELSHGKMYGYDADYSGFLELKAQREEMELASQRKRQSILRMELEWAKRGCRARTTKQKARLERLEALKAGKAPVTDQTVELDSVETRMGKKTIELHHVSKRFGEKKILDDFSYIVLRNQRLGIIGPNGCGKSTILKMIAGVLKPDAGEIEIGETIKIGYFAQEEQHMDDSQRVIDYVKDIAEYVTTKDGQISASQLLERFLFTPDMQYAPIGKLSGGEKRRLYLLGVLAENANVLLFDEAGNNLDIPTLTILEDYLNSFTGIVITVSHDRYFLDNVVDRIFELDGNGGIRQFEGGYTDYVEAKKRRFGEESKAITGKSEIKAAEKSTEEETQEKKNRKELEGRTAPEGEVFLFKGAARV